MSLQKVLIKLQQATNTNGKLISRFVLKEKDTNAGMGLKKI